ncbi:MAG: HAD-IA family hydrolase [Ghiorsea sp.]|nr:HAD-IA family hydrolase [Ghiorsea sp.]MDQ6981220.1 HAD-IA family hydrolase [Ghiorsea sp.]
MIKMVAFDLFGVVITEGHMVSNALMPLLPQGTSLTMVKSFYNPYTRGEISEETFWQGIGQPEYKQLRQDFLHTFFLNAELPKVLQVLSGKYRLAILSNLGKDWADTLITKFQFEQTFSPIIISGKEGCQKPNPAIYERLLVQSQLDADEIMFIDDRLENLAAAHVLGMKTVHYKHEPDDFDFQADYQIQKMSELQVFL